MTKEQTLSIIKPDAVAKNVIGEILNQFERSGLKIVAMRMVQLSQDQAKDFYAVHKERPFYMELVNFMCTGPAVVLVLEGEGAVMKNRELMGATNPAQAAPGTIRAKYADSIQENAVHGSDSIENARKELMFFFNPTEICPRRR